jgi:D-alanyl-D-alanine carboxypeptidase
MRETRKAIAYLMLAIMFAVLGACASTTTTSDSPTGPFDAATRTRFDDLMSETLKAYDSPGMILYVYIPGRGEYVCASGIADIANGTPMTTTPLFRIGSLTKTFTGTVILELMDEGLIQLDDKVGDYISGVPNGDAITIRHLLTMRSGLPSYSESEDFGKLLLANPQRSFTPQELLSFAFALPIQFPPGTSYHYSNTNTVLLGLIIEKVNREGDDLGGAIQRKISDPLDLRNTYFPTDGSMPGEYIHGYYTPVATREDWSLANPSWGWAAGAMISNLSDLKIYVKALGQGPLSKPETQAQRMSEWYDVGNTQVEFPSARYGLGWFTLGGFVGHNGALPGYVNISMYDPSTGAMVILMLNTQPPQGAATMMIFKEVINIIFPERTV